jgi:hypothetical protein
MDVSTSVKAGEPGAFLVGGWSAGVQNALIASTYPVTWETAAIRLDGEGRHH